MNKKIFTFMSKKIFIISFLVCGLAFWMFLGYLRLTFNETKEFVKDEYNNKKLIEYFTYDSNKLRLQIIEGEDSRWIKHPDCCIKLKGHVPDNEIKFSRDNDKLLIVNGKEFTIDNEK